MFSLWCLTGESLSWFVQHELEARVTECTFPASRRIGQEERGSTPAAGARFCITTLRADCGHLTVDRVRWGLYVPSRTSGTVTNTCWAITVVVWVSARAVLSYPSGQLVITGRRDIRRFFFHWNYVKNYNAVWSLLPERKNFTWFWLSKNLKQFVFLCMGSHF